MTPILLRFEVFFNGGVITTRRSSLTLQIGARGRKQQERTRRVVLRSFKLRRLEPRGENICGKASGHDDYMTGSTQAGGLTHLLRIPKFGYSE